MGSRRTYSFLVPCENSNSCSDSFIVAEVRHLAPKAVWVHEPHRSLSDKTDPPTHHFLLRLIPFLAEARSASVFSTVGCALE